MGKVTSPKATPGDMLFLGSGSGETESLVAIAKKAKVIGMKIVLITANSNSDLEQLGSQVVPIKAKGKYDSRKTEISEQPIGALFEQGLLIYLDSIIRAEMEKRAVTNEDMRELHANLK